MGWEGRQEVTGFYGGQHGGSVQLGSAQVPPKAEMTFEGSKGTPDATLRFEIRDGRPECTEIHVVAKPDGRGIRSADLVMIGIDNITVAVFAELATELMTDEGDALRAFRDISEARSARRNAMTREDLEKVARTYRDHISANPTAMVGRLLGVSHRTAARRVAQARDAGLLPATTPGQRKA